jgi:hypothetical protein
VADIDKSFAFGVPLPMEVLVPRLKVWKRLLEERPRLYLVAGVAVNVQRGDGVKGRLDLAGSLAVTWSVRAAIGT